MKDKEYIKRFGLGRMIEHHVFAIVFMTLVCTGLAQRFYDASWSEWLVTHAGGIDQLRLIHRSTGVVFSLLTIQHIVIGAHGLIFKHWAPTMMISIKDFRDAIQNLKYYFGIHNNPARCDRYDYKQKFEYWGVILGGLLMITTGLMLWFPSLTFQILPFLPGQVIPAAKVAHSNECMLALLVIVIWHIYNAIFSPEVFPMDTGIFTGKISKERCKHEHPLEYERITGTKIEEHFHDIKET